MSGFKSFLTDRTNAFLQTFQEKHDGLSDAHVKAVLMEGAEKAQDHAQEVLTRTRRAMGFVAFA
jgi:hypothetical protein